jgi:hypothetical protein
MEGLAIDQFESISQRFSGNNTNRSIAHDRLGLRERLTEQGIEFRNAQLS